jgi:hypothetical protein
MWRESPPKTKKNGLFYEERDAFMEEGEMQASSLWLLRVNQQAYHLFCLAIHDRLRRCDNNWFGRFCDDKKC